jgi:hypothetical protein
MKLSIWDILTGVMLLGSVILVAVVGSLLLNPPTAVGGEFIPTISIPTSTITPPVMPSTWTPTAVDTESPNVVLPTLRPSSTPEPTVTPFQLPTFTVAPTTSSSGGGSGGGTSGGNCRVISQSPQDNLTLDRNYDFVMNWTIQNTSNETWQAAAVDLRFVTGERMHYGPDAYDLTQDVPPQGTLNVVVNMRMPSSSGTFVSNWGLYDGVRSVCRFYVQLKSR